MNAAKGATKASKSDIVLEDFIGNIISYRFILFKCKYLPVESFCPLDFELHLAFGFRYSGFLTIGIYKKNKRTKNIKENSKGYSLILY